jgi:hypothetical protein
MSVMFDFDSIKKRLQDRLKAKTSWANILFFSTNQRIIDIVAEEIAYSMQYDEMLARESKWNLAQQITSIMSENQFFNYFPHRKIGATNFLKVSTSKTFNSSFSKNVIIPKYSMFSNGNLNFCSIETTTITPLDLFKSIQIVQGVAKQLSFSASGETNEYFEIQNPSIENSMFDVFVNGELFQKVDSLLEADSGSSKVYELKDFKDFSGVRLSFGDNIFGKKLNNNDSVIFKFIETDGLNGNVYSQNSITKVISTIYDEENLEVDLYCTNDYEISGGLDYENIEQIKVNAPKSYKSGNVAITTDDYKAIMSKFSFVKKVNVWGESEVNEDLHNEPGTLIPQEENVVHVCLISSETSGISQEQELQIREDILTKKSPTEIIVFEQPNFVYIAFTVSAYILEKQHSISFVSDNIYFSLKEAYSLDSMNFKNSIFQSDYISTVSKSSGVGYHNTTFKLYQILKFQSAYVCELNFAIENIKENSIKIYLLDKSEPGNVYTLIGVDDGSGNLISTTETYDLSVSNIYYETGVGNLIIVGGLSGSHTNYDIKIDFETESNNILSTERNQIILFGSSSITVNYA